jgi:uncharacterized protein DUF4232
MQLRTRLTGKLIAVSALSAAAFAMPAAALAITSGPVQHARPQAAAAPCRFQQIKTWLGIGNGSTGPRTYSYPLEFTNVGRFTCSLFGHPGVSGVIHGHQVGGAAVRVGSKRVVILGRGQTAHAHLTLRIAGKVAGCHARSGVRLKVFAPNQTGSTIIYGFTFTACSNRTTLAVTSVHSGTGIPGFSS